MTRCRSGEKLKLDEMEWSDERERSDTDTDNSEVSFYKQPIDGEHLHAELDFKRHHATATRQRFSLSSYSIIDVEVRIRLHTSLFSASIQSRTSMKDKRQTRGKRLLGFFLNKMNRKVDRVSQSTHFIDEHFHFILCIVFVIHCHAPLLRSLHAACIVIRSLCKQATALYSQSFRQRCRTNIPMIDQPYSSIIVLCQRFIGR